MSMTVTQGLLLLICVAVTVELTIEARFHFILKSLDEKFDRLEEAKARLKELKIKVDMMHSVSSNEDSKKPRKS